MAKEPSTLDEAIEYYSKANDDLQAATVIFFEKIALYSGAIISLSITFLGYLLSKDPSVFLHTTFGIPLYAIIFAAWVLLAAALFLGIYIRLFVASHISRQMHGQYLRLFIKSRESIVDKIQVGEAYWDGDMSEEKAASTLEQAKDALTAYGEVEEGTKKGLAWYEFFSPYIRRTAIGLFALGCLLTLLFVALSTFTKDRFSSGSKFYMMCPPNLI